MAVFAASIAASADDAFQNGADTSVNVNATALELDNAADWAGFRFLNVTIPQSSTVSAATMTVYLPHTDYDNPDLNIYCQDDDDAGTFVATNSNISSRARTDAFTNWTATNLNTGTKTTPDFAAAVQEVVSRVGWASGNDLVVIFDMIGNGPFRIRSWDNGTSHQATISITYTAPAAGNAARAMHILRLGR